MSLSNGKWAFSDSLNYILKPMINQVTIQTGVHPPPLNKLLVIAQWIPQSGWSVLQRESAFQREGAFPFRKMLSAQHLLFLRSADAATCSEGVLA
jgi:hypothetical protein